MLQVLYTITSASLTSSAHVYPALSSVPAIRSESARFICAACLASSSLHVIHHHIIEPVAPVQSSNGKGRIRGLAQAPRHRESHASRVLEPSHQVLHYQHSMHFSAKLNNSGLHVTLLHGLSTTERAMHAEQAYDAPLELNSRDCHTWQPKVWM